jgi:c(7)-type cytochrome triheme protein
MTHGRAVKLALVVAGALVLGGAGFQKLPDDYRLPQGDGSPGPVTFSHANHVDPKKNACLACHPKQFRITEKGKTLSGKPITHQVMEAGGLCGSCHGKQAFGFDDCGSCHQQ